MQRYRRVPRVRNLEYLFAYLNGLKSEGEAGAQKYVQQKRIDFEKDKAEAMGGGKYIQKVKVEHLVEECHKMAMQLGLINKTNDEVKLNELEPKLKVFLEGNLEDKVSRYSMIEKFFLTYESFRHLIYKIRETYNGKIFMTIERGEKFFRKIAERYGLEISQWDLEIVRDIGSQLGVLNWRLLNEQETSQYNLGKKGIVIYLTSYVVNLSDLYKINQLKDRNFYFNILEKFVDELKIKDMSGVARDDMISIAIKNGFLAIPLEKDDVVFIKEFEPLTNIFEETLWKKYLELANHVAGTPVIYVELRDAVCEELLISDAVFDRMIMKMIDFPDNYGLKVYPAEGILPRFISDNRKNLPPKVGYGIFAVYLIIYKRRIKDELKV